MSTLASASGVFGARADDIEDLIDSLNLMMTTFRHKQVSLDGLIRSMSVLSDKWSEANTDITTPINDLRTVFDQINDFVLQHGGDVGAGLTNPISFPISASDPLGIVSAVSGGALPKKSGGR